MASIGPYRTSTAFSTALNDLRRNRTRLLTIYGVYLHLVSGRTDFFARAICRIRARILWLDGSVGPHQTDPKPGWRSKRISRDGTSNSFGSATGSNTNRIVLLWRKCKLQAVG